MIGWLELAVLALATFRFSYMLALEAGPWRVFARIRKALGAEDGVLENGKPKPLTGKVVSCALCNSVYVATGFYLLFTTFPQSFPLFAILSLSGVASLAYLAVKRG